MTPMNKCLIWPNSGATVRPQGRGLTWTVESARAGGKYEIDVLARDMVKGLGLRVRARLTTWLVDQRCLGSQCPKITPEIVESAKVKRPLHPDERATRLLRFVAGRMRTIGTSAYIYPDDAEAYAWSESAEPAELETLIIHLHDSKLLIAYKDIGYYVCRVTMEGYHQITEQESSVATIQAFIAMWFHDSMDDAFEKGIKPAIEGAGYKPLRIDQKPDVNKIDDEIIAEIRRSRFLVADFTHGDEGARGGVYFEAGFAEGLGIPVIYTCRNDMVDKLHFDTRQYAHIDWETPDELRDRLLHRIRARIGEGPGDNVAL